ncbi:MAG: hypothetical protein ACFBSG_01890, partial [Leptolyngbyaceae cyanobacterium]
MSASLRVVLFLGKPESGGITRFISLMALGLASRQFEVQIVTYCNAEFFASLISEKISVLELDIEAQYRA